ncbi:unnamed protein product [Mycena citricolor]|uniref:Uncharacterized protein n=1 Tax=Mycena citricolor TaxID=2018698 RepID=A0AAD2H9E8_9AGAR|nr:unnamed protein product [Mycena citricolor]
MDAQTYPAQLSASALTPAQQTQHHQHHQHHHEQPQHQQHFLPPPPASQPPPPAHPGAHAPDPLYTAMLQCPRPTWKVTALCSSPRSPADSTRTVFAGPWRHPCELEYIGPHHPSAHMWSDFAILAYLVGTGVTVPPRRGEGRETWVEVRVGEAANGTGNGNGNGSGNVTTTTLPRGYRIPLLWLMRVQWESLRLLLTSARPMWDILKFDLLHIGRLVTQFLAKARNEARMKRGWRDPMFDRVLTRFFNGWMGCRDPFIWDFYREFRDEEYKEDVLTRRWAPKVAKGIQGFIVTDEELVMGITAVEYMQGLKLDAERGMFTWEMPPEIAPPLEAMPTPIKAVDPTPTIAIPAAALPTPTIAAPAIATSSVTATASSTADALTASPSPDMPGSPLTSDGESGTYQPHPSVRKKASKSSAGTPRPLRTRTISGGTSAAGSPAAFQVTFTAPIESRGRKRKIADLYNSSNNTNTAAAAAATASNRMNTGSPLTSDNEEDEESSVTGTATRAGSGAPDGRAGSYGVPSRVVAPRLAGSSDVFGTPAEPEKEKEKEKEKESAEALTAAEIPGPERPPYKLYAISSSPSTQPFQRMQDAVIPPFGTWRHAAELGYVVDPERWSDFDIVAFLAQTAWSVPDKTAVSTAGKSWIDVEYRHGEVRVAVPRGYRVPLLWFGRVLWDCVKLLLTTSKLFWPEMKWDVLHMARLADEFFAHVRAAQPGNVKRGWRDVMLDRVLTRFFNGWMGVRDEFVWDFYREFRDEEYQDDMVGRRWHGKAVKGIQGFAVTETQLVQGITREQFTDGLVVDHEHKTYRWEVPEADPVSPPPPAAVSSPAPAPESVPAPVPVPAIVTAPPRPKSPLSLTQVAATSPSPMIVNVDIDPDTTITGPPDPEPEFDETEFLRSRLPSPFGGETPVEKERKETAPAPALVPARDVSIPPLVLDDLGLEDDGDADAVGDDDDEVQMEMHQGPPHIQVFEEPLRIRIVPQAQQQQQQEQQQQQHEQQQEPQMEMEEEDEFQGLVIEPVERLTLPPEEMEEEDEEQELVIEFVEHPTLHQEEMEEEDEEQELVIEFVEHPTLHQEEMEEEDEEQELVIEFVEHPTLHQEEMEEEDEFQGLVIEPVERLALPPEEEEEEDEEQELVIEFVALPTLPQEEMEEEDEFQGLVIEPVERLTLPPEEEEEEEEEQELVIEFVEHLTLPQEEEEQRNQDDVGRDDSIRSSSSPSPRPEAVPAPIDDGSDTDADGDIEVEGDLLFVGVPQREEERLAQPVPAPEPERRDEEATVRVQPHDDKEKDDDDEQDLPPGLGHHHLEDEVVFLGANPPSITDDDDDGTTSSGIPGLGLNFGLGLSAEESRQVKVEMLADVDVPFPARSVSPLVVPAAQSLAVEPSPTLPAEDLPPGLEPRSAIDAEAETAPPVVGSEPELGSSREPEPELEPEPEPVPEPELEPAPAPAQDPETERQPTLEPESTHEPEPEIEPEIEPTPELVQNAPEKTQSPLPEAAPVAAAEPAAAAPSAAQNNAEQDSDMEQDMEVDMDLDMDLDMDMDIETPIESDVERAEATTTTKSPVLVAANDNGRDDGRVEFAASDDDCGSGNDYDAEKPTAQRVAKSVHTGCHACACWCRGIKRHVGHTRCESADADERHLGCEYQLCRSEIHRGIRIRVRDRDRAGADAGLAFFLGGRKLETAVECDAAETDGRIQPSGQRHQQLNGPQANLATSVAAPPPPSAPPPTSARKTTAATGANAWPVSGLGLPRNVTSSANSAKPKPKTKKGKAKAGASSWPPPHDHQQQQQSPLDSGVYYDPGAGRYGYDQRSVPSQSWYGAPPPSSQAPQDEYQPYSPLMSLGGGVGPMPMPMPMPTPSAMIRNPTPPVNARAGVRTLPGFEIPPAVLRNPTPTPPPPAPPPMIIRNPTPPPVVMRQPTPPPPPPKPTKVTADRSTSPPPVPRRMCINASVVTDPLPPPPKEIDLEALEARLLERLRAEMPAPAPPPPPPPPAALKVDVDALIAQLHAEMPALVARMRAEMPEPQEPREVDMDALVARVREAIAVPAVDEAALEARIAARMPAPREPRDVDVEALAARLRGELGARLDGRVDELREAVCARVMAEVPDAVHARVKADLMAQMGSVLGQMQADLMAQLRDDVGLQLRYFVAKLKEDMGALVREAVAANLAGGQAPWVGQVKAVLGEQLRDALAVQREVMNRDFERRRAGVAARRVATTPAEATTPVTPSHSNAVSSSSTAGNSGNSGSQLKSVLFPGRHPLHHLVLSATAEDANADGTPSQTRPSTPMPARHRKFVQPQSGLTSPASENPVERPAGTEPAHPLPLPPPPTLMADAPLPPEDAQMATPPPPPSAPGLAVALAAV